MGNELLVFFKKGGEERQRQRQIETETEKERLLSFVKMLFANLPVKAYLTSCK